MSHAPWFWQLPGAENQEMTLLLMCQDSVPKSVAKCATPGKFQSVWVKLILMWFSFSMHTLTQELLFALLGPLIYSPVPGKISGASSGQENSAGGMLKLLSLDTVVLIQTEPTGPGN